MIMCQEAFTKHGRDRWTSRRIFPGVVDLILDYGECASARDDAQKFFLTKASVRKVRREYGPGIAKALQPYRAAYIVVCGGKIVTVAFSPRPFNRRNHTVTS